MVFRLTRRAALAAVHYQPEPRVSNRVVPVRIAPVLISPCDTKAMSWTLDSTQRVDVTGECDQGCCECGRWATPMTPLKKLVRRRAAGSAKRRPRRKP